MRSDSIGVLLVVVLTVSCASAPHSSLTSPPVTPAVDAAVSADGANAALDRAYRRGDADAVAALLSDSVVISAANIPDLIGRSTIRDALRQFFASNTVEAYTLSPLEVYSMGERAFERGTFTWAAGPHGRPAVRRTGRYMLLRIHESDGAWRIHRLIENCLPAPCP